MSEVVGTGKKVMNEKLFTVFLQNTVYFEALKMCKQVALILFSNHNVF